MADGLQPTVPIKPDQILDIIVRRRWLIVIPLCLTLTLGLVLTLVVPKTYQASTLILVQQQSVPTEYVRSVVTSSINQRINTISQQILSRSNLEKIIDQFGLYADRPDMYLEDKVFDMRRRVEVKIEQARQGTEAFSIKFTGSDPRRVMRIANTLASYFMDENLKVREAQVVGTSEFLDTELEKTRRRLEEMEHKLSVYRSRHLGGLPDELEANLRTLDRLSQQMADKHAVLREAKNSLSLVKSQIDDIRKQAQQSMPTLSGTLENNTGFSGTENQEKLFLARQEYDQLLTAYTKHHPDVQKLEKTIENLEQIVAKELVAQGPEDQSDADGLSQHNPELQRLELARDQIENDIRKTTFEITEIEKKMEVYQKRVEETPERELELQSLNRDYANIRDTYNSLLNRKLEAELSVNMEKRQKGEQFRIVDSARVPEKPISPDVRKYFFLSVVAGFGMAAGIIFLLEFFDKSLRRDEQIEDELGLTILATIPELQAHRTKTKKWFEMTAFVGCSIYAAVLLMFFAVLHVRGLDRTINSVTVFLDF
jgi:polysaccharide chain length determinant protein (PEP-CTERM system associated)